MTYENFAYYYDSLMDDSFYEDYLSFILNHASFQTVLELGCGTGEIALKLAKKQKDVYATDLSTDMLEVAYMKALEKEVNIHFACVDMRDFICDQTVDLILCLCDSLNYITVKDDILAVFQHVYQSLDEKGTFIFDVNSLYKTDVVLKDYQEINEDDEFFFSWQVKNIAKGRIKHIIEIKDKINHESVKETHLQKTFDSFVYQALLQKVGFKKIDLYGDFDTMDQHSQRIIYVCKKGIVK